jgi:beta-lactamase superfamily II metal-dependent hydrolase
MCLRLTWLMAREPGQRPRWWTSFTSSWLPNVALGVAAFGALAAWNTVLNLPDGKLRVTFFDMGQGDSILIETPSGRYALIDGGSSPGKLAESLGRTLPAGAHTLDLVVTASPAFDSLGGLPGLFDRYTIGQVLLAGDPARTAAYREWVEGVAGRSIPMLTAETGQAVDLGNGITLTVVAPLPTGAILRLEDGNSSFLFPVALDAVTANELATARQIAPATVLLAPSHAGKDSVSASFVAAANPYAVVVSVGAGNANADPQSDTLDLFTGHTVLRTDERGTIVFATDGQQLWVEGER